MPNEMKGESTQWGILRQGKGKKYVGKAGMSTKDPGKSAV